MATENANGREMPIPIPSYEEAHRYADTLVPPELWAQAHADLSHLDPLFDRLGRSFGATIRIDGGPKHPYPRRDLLKHIQGETLIVGIGLDPTALGSARRYAVGVGRSPRQRFFRRRRPETWTHVADVTAQALAEGRAAIIALVERTVERTFGALNQAI